MTDLIQFIFPPAHAQEATTAVPATPAPGAMPAPSGADMLMQFMPLILILFVFYFLLLRPQQKKMKEHKQMLDNLRRGDKVLTSGGIVGTVVKLDGAEYLVIEISDGVHVRLSRPFVQDVLSKTEPANSNTPAKSDDKNADKK